MTDPAYWPHNAPTTRGHALAQHRRLVRAGQVDLLPDASYWLRIAIRAAANCR